LSDGEEEDHRPGTIIYLRVSGDEQARDGVSLNTQEEKLRALADAKDFRLPHYGVRITVPLGAAAATLQLK
jgi:DNA invertase Pin-like site-specific DNA recombinase